ncbi:MAG TPA: DNA topoisomerase IB [Acidobacteriaceae bacterium]
MADATLPAPPESAKEAGLRYVSDADPGICRKRRGKGFTYVGPNGETVRDQKTLVRIRSLVIPPAWTNVWICASPNGHLQATGRDAKGRKQSRYHPRWREVRDETKYERMLSFGAALTTIRAQVEQDLSAPGLPRRKIMASIVRLMETTLIRVGNEEYARTNHSYGLTTMHDRHARVEGSTITFKFKGKSGKSHTIDVSDRRLAKIIRRCQDIPGYELFQYIDDEGATHSVDSADVNEYLREISQQDFTAKDFRTWYGSVLAFSTLGLLDPFESATQSKKNVVEAIKSVAERLGNTPSVCRKCYVHPALLDCYLAGSMNGATKNGSKPAVHAARASQGLSAEECGLIHLLERALPDSKVSAGRK